jgi:hypothetical protein
MISYEILGMVKIHRLEIQLMMVMMMMTTTMGGLKADYFSPKTINQPHKYRHMRCSIDTYVDSAGFTTSGRDDLSPPRLLGGHRK